MSSPQIRFMAFIICILGATFYMYEFTLQVSISVMTQQLMQDYLNNRRHVMFFSTLVSCFVLMLILYCPMTKYLAAILLFIFGFGLGSFMLAFSIGKEINSLALTATVVAMINSSDALLDGITEPTIGKLLDFFWDGKIVNGVHFFSLQNFHIALSVLPVYLLLAAMMLLGVRDCKLK